MAADSEPTTIGQAVLLRYFVFMSLVLCFCAFSCKYDQNFVNIDWTFVSVLLISFC